MSIDKKFLISILAILVFVIDIGYARFSDAISVSGTSNISGSFDIQFENATVVNAVGVNKRETMVNVLNNGNLLMVNVSDLAYPGAGVEFSVDIVNKGTIPAKIESIKTNRLKGDEVIVNFPNFSNKVLKPNESCNIHFTIVWDQNCTKLVSEEINFSVVMNYIQAI